MTEPVATAAIIALFGALLAISALMTAHPRPVRRTIDNAEFAFRIGTVALVLILFDGGLNTRWSVIWRASIDWQNHRRRKPSVGRERARCRHWGR